jgi:hypothetical protein
MDETSARKVLLVQALETGLQNNLIWAEEDAAWASRLALTDKSSKDKFEKFLIRRTEYAIKKIEAREPTINKWLSIRLWYSNWLLWILPIGLLLGLIGNSIGSSQYINLINPPILIVVLWNLFTYILLLLHFFRSFLKRTNVQLGWKVKLVQFIKHKTNFDSRDLSENNIIQIVKTFERLWFESSASLSFYRVATFLHALAATFATGLIIGLYLRGLVFDYRVAWESTFLSANNVHNVLSTVLYPATLLSGISLPDVEALDAIRIVHGGLDSGISAAPWIHLYSITLLLFIVLPRTALMLWNLMRSYWLAKYFTLPVDNEYFARLKRQHNGDTPPDSIALSFISHSKKVKSTMLHTLLGDNMEVENEANLVNESGSIHILIETPHSEQLLLWDIPELGNSNFVVKPSQDSVNFFGTIKSQVWDRLSDNSNLENQQITSNIRSDSDVILYFIDEIENPNLQVYLSRELKLLDLIGKPVIILLNQTAENIRSDLNKTKITFWNTHLANYEHIKSILLIDELTRCWVQEDLLFHTIETVLEGERRLLMVRLRGALQSRSKQTFNEATHSLSNSLAKLVTDFEVVEEKKSFNLNLKIIDDTPNVNNEIDSKSNETKLEVAQKTLTVRLESEIKANTLELIHLHKLNEQMYQEYLESDALNFEVLNSINENKTTLYGAVLSGMLTGLGADLAAVGLSLGTGMIAGAIIGGLGGKGIAKGVNHVRKSNQSRVIWGNDALNNILEAALFRYITVIQTGRPQNLISQIEPTSLWVKAIQNALALQHKNLEKVWKLRNAETNTQIETRKLISATIEPIISESLCNVFHTMYPNAPKIDDLKAIPSNTTKQLKTQNV